ncbi:MAG: sensor histidine kinase [bacterium]
MKDEARTKKDLLQDVRVLRARIAQLERREANLFDIAEQEKARLARDLHDDLSQVLTALSIFGGKLHKDLAAAGREEAALAGQIVVQVEEVSRMVRGLSRSLCSVDLDPGGLQDALERLAAHASELFGIRCECRCERLPQPQLKGKAAHIYRIAQEAVTNAVRHGQARHVRVSLAREGGRIILAVEDDGTGIPEPVPAREGLGLRIMRYRARILRATLKISRSGARGTVLTCTIPCGDPSP